MPQLCDWLPVSGSNCVVDFFPKLCLTFRLGYTVLMRTKKSETRVHGCSFFFFCGHTRKKKKNFILVFNLIPALRSDFSFSF